VGWIGLGQNLGWAEWASIGGIVAANTLSIATRYGSASRT
jgi:inner membrane transporter RhtA